MRAGTCPQATGRLRYAPPEDVAALEQGQVATQATAAADVWALGVVAFEILTRTRVFGAAATEKQMRDAISGRHSMPWERMDAAARQRLAQLRTFKRSVMLCLERNPHRRPRATEVVQMWTKLFYASSPLYQNMRFDAPPDGAPPTHAPHAHAAPPPLSGESPGSHAAPGSGGYSAGLPAADAAARGSSSTASARRGAAAAAVLAGAHITAPAVASSHPLEGAREAAAGAGMHVAAGAPAGIVSVAREDREGSAGAATGAQRIAGTAGMPTHETTTTTGHGVMLRWPMAGLSHHTSSHRTGSSGGEGGSAGGEGGHGGGPTWPAARGGGAAQARRSGCRLWLRAAHCARMLGGRAPRNLCKGVRRDEGWGSGEGSPGGLRGLCTREQPAVVRRTRRRCCVGALLPQ